MSRTIGATSHTLYREMNAVSDLELLTMMTGCVASARAILGHYPSWRQMARASVSELTQIHGIDFGIAKRIVSAFELFRRKEEEEFENLKCINSQAIARYMIAKYADCEQEVFSVLYTSRNLELIAEEALFIGGISAAIVDPRVIFKKAIKYLSSSIFLVHNHPSGNLHPSQADIAITQKIKEGARILDISLLDHIIVSSRGYYSFADEGIL